jgi:Zn-dependent peptidase ImmA (M78 family)
VQPLLSLPDPLVDSVVVSSRNPKHEAERLLRTVWARLSPARRIPVDPVRISKELGIEVFEAALGPTVSGAIRKEPGADPTILLNWSDSPVRQRFSCAHELGHYVLRSDQPDAYRYVDHRGPAASDGTDPDEVFANSFAAHLLMPEDDVRQEVEHGTGAVELAFLFRVSQEAMTYRLRNLGLRVA